MDSFGLPVTRRDAKAWLERFVTERRPEFGPYEDALEATRDLPRRFWAPDGEAYDGTRSSSCVLPCLADSIRQVRDHGRTHHINRLMVQGNFATLFGVEPAALSRWFWAAFTDAYEWVELPNVAWPRGATAA